MIRADELPDKVDRKLVAFTVGNWKYLAEREIKKANEYHKNEFIDYDRILQYPICFEDTIEAIEKQFKEEMREYGYRVRYDYLENGNSYTRISW